jgi:hypothetical protein
MDKMRQIEIKTFKITASISKNIKNKAKKYENNLKSCTEAAVILYLFCYCEFYTFILQEENDLLFDLLNFTVYIQIY